MKALVDKTRTLITTSPSIIQWYRLKTSSLITSVWEKGGIMQSRITKILLPLRLLTFAPIFLSAFAVASLTTCSTPAWQLQGIAPTGSGEGGTKCDAPRDDLFKNPFNKNSAHHRPIGTGATYAGDDDLSTKDILRYGFGSVNPGGQGGGGFIVVTAQPNDQIKTVLFRNTTASGCCENQFPVTLQYTAGLDTMNADGVIVVYDPARQKIHDFYHWDVTDGQATASIHYATDIKDIGHPSQIGGNRVGVSSTGVEGLFGLMRGYEVNTPGYKIQHVAQFTIPQANGAQMANHPVWPAGYTDWFAKTSTGHVPYGGLLALLPESKGGPNLDSLGLSEPGKRLAESLRDYGGYAIDTGPKVTNMRADQDVDPAVRSQLTADMKKIYQYLRLVTNNEKDQTASGGGAPLAPNCAFDAQ
jgi:hypothetical protein